MERTLRTLLGLVIGLAIAAAGCPLVCLADDVVQITDESEPVTPAALYTQEDLEVLAHVICGEAQCYDDQEQLYVGSVVLNRVADPRYPNTIKGVVFQKGQYACTWDGNYNRTPTARNWANAVYLLTYGSQLPANVIYQSGRRQGKGVYVKTLRHYYCY